MILDCFGTFSRENVYFRKNFLRKHPISHACPCEKHYFRSDKLVNYYPSLFLSCEFASLGCENMTFAEFSLRTSRLRSHNSCETYPFADIPLRSIIFRTWIFANNRLSQNLSCEMCLFAKILLRSLGFRKRFFAKGTLSQCSTCDVWTFAGHVVASPQFPLAKYWSSQRCICEI